MSRQKLIDGINATLDRINKQIRDNNAVASVVHQLPELPYESITPHAYIGVAEVKLKANSLEELKPMIEALTPVPIGYDIAKNGWHHIGPVEGFSEKEKQGTEFVDVYPVFFDCRHIVSHQTSNANWWYRLPETGQLVSVEVELSCHRHFRFDYTRQAMQGEYIITKDEFKPDPRWTDDVVYHVAKIGGGHPKTTPSSRCIIFRHGASLHEILLK